MGYFIAWLRHFLIRHPMARLYWREDYYMKVCAHDSPGVNGCCANCGASMPYIATTPGDVSQCTSASNCPALAGHHLTGCLSGMGPIVRERPVILHTLGGSRCSECDTNQNDGYHAEGCSALEGDE